MIALSLRCLAMFVDPGKRRQGLFARDIFTACAAADLSAKSHIVTKNTPCRIILGRTPERHDEIRTTGKVMYRLEPIVADNGKLIHVGHAGEILYRRERGS